LDHICLEDVDRNSTPPRDGDVEHCAKDEEEDELEQAALHGNILRHIFPSPAAFGATATVLLAKKVGAPGAQSALGTEETAQCE